MAAHPLASIRTTTDPLSRRIECPVCRAMFRVPRRGMPGGALAATAKLRGMLSEHIQRMHPVPVATPG